MLDQGVVRVSVNDYTCVYYVDLALKTARGDIAQSRTVEVYWNCGGSIAALETQ